MILAYVLVIAVFAICIIATNADNIKTRWFLPKVQHDVLEKAQAVDDRTKMSHSMLADWEERFALACGPAYRNPFQREYTPRPTVEVIDDYVPPSQRYSGRYEIERKTAMLNEIRAIEEQHRKQTEAELTRAGFLTVNDVRAAVDPFFYTNAEDYLQEAAKNKISEEAIDRLGTRRS